MSEPAGIPLLDDHAHPFPLATEPLDPAELSLSVGAGAGARRRAAAPARLMVEALLVELSRLLGCPPEDALAAREDAARDWPAWVRRLMADAAIGGMLLDGGPSLLGPAELEPLGGLAGIRTWSLLRLEAVVDPLLEQGADGPSIEAALRDAVAAGVAGGAAGLKTVLAYRTGLAVDPDVRPDDAYRAAEAVDRAQPLRRQAKPLRDYLLRRTLAQCADLGVPIQFHTGFGDSEIRLADADPLLLDDLLRTPEGAAAQVVLIHSSYPWHEHAAYLAFVRENVHAEISLVNLFSPATTADRMLRLLDLAPADRLLFGTDGHGAPETHWFAAVTLRRAWDEVARRLTGTVRPGWLAATAERVFHANAEDLYALGAVQPGRAG